MHHHHWNACIFILREWIDDYYVVAAVRGSVIFNCLCRLQRGYPILRYLASNWKHSKRNEGIVIVTVCFCNEFLCVWFSVRDWALEPQITSEHQAKPIFLSEDKNASMFFLYVNFEWNSFFFRWKIVRSLACEAFLYGQTFTFFAFQYSVQFSGVNVKLTRFWSSCGISFGPEIWNRKIGNVFPNLDSSPPESKAIFSGESKYQLISCFSSFRRVC